MAARLDRQPRKKPFMEIYAPYILIVCIIILILLIIGLIMTFAGVHAFQLTGTEANVHQNIQQII